uniref:Core shell protein Gag P30 domain-containing protein n=1 Tax=Corvus moneduloides TaxID=1196302 RepID=A0A8C3E6Y0_CORMO
CARPKSHWWTRSALSCQWERAGRRGHPRLQLSCSPAAVLAPGRGRGKREKREGEKRPTAVTLVKVPFSPVDLEAWVRLAGPYREDPERVFRVFETILKAQNPDWGIIQVLLDTLLDSTEREMVLRTARKEVDRTGTAGALPGTVEEHFPSQDPHWDPNTKEERYGNLTLQTRMALALLLGKEHGGCGYLKLDREHSCVHIPNVTEDLQRPQNVASG